FDLLINAGDLSLSGMTLRNGDPQGGIGGAILNEDNTVTLTDVRLTGNTADKGGAIYIFVGNAQLDVNRALFDNNTATEGGAIFGTDAGVRINITNATITGNTGSSKGGAMWVDHVALVNSTIVGNTSPDAAGVYKDSSETFAAINSIIANNTGADCNVTFNSGNNNIDSDGTCGFATTANPLLTALGDYGGPTDTMYPQSGSPAVEGGTNVSCPALDQRSESRPQGALCDVGAVEAASGGICPGGIVTTTTDSTIGGSLRACVIWANSNPGDDTITLPAGTYTLTLTGAGENAAATGDLDIADAAVGLLTINGAGARTTIIDGNGADRIFHVLSNQGDLALSNMTLRNGNSQGADGGAILNADNILTLTDVTLTGNTAATKAGGAIWSAGGDARLDINRATLTNNSAADGGAIYGSGGGVRIQITNATFNANTATRGGALYVDHLAIVNSTIAGNTASAGQGGGVNESGGQLFTAINSIIANNTGGDCISTIDSGNNNIDSDGTCGFATTADPKLGALANNGGPTDTMYPQSGSPAIEG
ncbi:MAG TPA: choice-of-anchor Q domain-containing protein, partial [Afifellaceae bacterium]|nr:choice-of-anchor Q domain-containing protein [Afifellaceae bacterium]